MLPYNTGKYHETLEGGIPMLLTVDHSLTETMFSLSPSSQFMYEPEVMESSSCGKSQGSAGPPTAEPHPGKDFHTPDGIISPTVEGMTFQDSVDPDELFSPLAFNNIYQLDRRFASSTPRMMFDPTLCGYGKGLEYIECGKWKQASTTSLDHDILLDNMSDDNDNGQKTSGCFDVLSDEITFPDRHKLDSLIPSISALGSFNLDGIGNDWFELDKDIYEVLSKDTDVLLQDPVFNGGPTLTQLNSKDLDPACLDDYNILEDLYAKTFSFEKLEGAAPSAGLDPVTIDSKFPIGVPAAVTSPKFTTCTVTSFVTSVSSGLLVANRGLCLLRGGVPDLNQKLSTQPQFPSIFAAKLEMAPIHVNPCFVPVVRSGLLVNDLIGAVVGGSAVPLVVSADPTKKSEQPMGKYDSNSKENVAEENWKEIERFLLGQNSGKQMPAPSSTSGENRSGLKIESCDVALNSLEELTDKESACEESDAESADVDYCDEDSYPGKSSDTNDFDTSRVKGKRYFWQYNTQSKGPKGKRLCKSVATDDPHVLNDFEDPVFDPEQNQTRYKHSGKARRGDGNDITPNPQKLYATGNELRELNRLIGAMTAPNEMPAGARARLLKEKNKYASRACRLKKKAQHEANKLKLHGLELEHCQLMKILVAIKKEIAAHFRNRDGLATESLTIKMEALIVKYLTLNVAGSSADYVNLILQKVAKGDRTGGIITPDDD